MQVRLIFAALAVLAFCSQGMARADPLDDLRAQLTRLEAENADLRARVRKLEDAAARPTGEARPIGEDSLQSGVQGRVATGDDAPPQNRAEQDLVEQGRANRDRGWTGLHLTVETGAGASRSDGFFLGPQPTLGKLSGPIAGGGLGADLQMGRVVLGGQIIAEYDGLSGLQNAYGNGSAAGSCITGPGASAYLAGAAQKQATCSAFEGLTGEFTGRIGYALLDNRLLAYVRGGVVMSRTASSYTYMDFPSPGEPYPSTLYGHGARFLAGAALGGGMEYRLSDLLSVGAEYQFREFDAKNLYSDYAYNIAQGVNIVKGYQIIGAQPQDRYDNLVRIFVSIHPFK